MLDRADGLTVRWTPPQGPPRRLRFDPRSDDRWTRVEEVWTGCRWRAEGQTVVERVRAEAPADQIVECEQCGRRGAPARIASHDC